MRLLREGSFTKDRDNKRYICDFCKVADMGLDILDDTEYAKGKKLYRKYRGMLPLTTRFKGAKVKNTVKRMKTVLCL